MRLIEVKDTKYQILSEPHELAYNYYVKAAKSCPDLFVLKNDVGFLFCRKVDDAELISDEGYLYLSC